MMLGELALGMAATLIALFLGIAPPGFMGGPPPSDPFGPLPYLGLLFGLGWMIRIYRGPADEPKFWRFLRS